MPCGARSVKRKRGLDKHQARVSPAFRMLRARVLSAEQRGCSTTCDTTTLSDFVWQHLQHLGLQGKPVSHNFLPLEMTAAKGATSVQVVSRITWAVASEVVITPTDYGALSCAPALDLHVVVCARCSQGVCDGRDGKRPLCFSLTMRASVSCLGICAAVVTDMHAAEVRTITRVSYTDTGKSIIHFAEPLQHSHYSALETYGSRSIAMQSHVGLLTRNIVIKGDGQGEEQTYHTWNVQQPSASASARCGNGMCEVGENSLTCPDCVGPAYEFGASILVGRYNEEYTVCDAYLQCRDGYRREFAGSLLLDHVELRYFGNKLHALYVDVMQEMQAI